MKGRSSSFLTNSVAAVFSSSGFQAADLAEEEDAANTQFTAVLKAATELVTEIDIGKHQMPPCFAPHWHIEALWSSCVAHVCSNHIVQQISTRSWSTSQLSA